MTARLSDAALDLARGGWAVFPVNAKTKAPRVKGGHLSATTDRARIKLWAHQFDWGGAIATPTGNGLLVVDVDPRNGGSVPSWCPPTLTVRTQSGGYHLYYHIDEDIKSRAGLFGPGVDSKCAGGYVLVPPSPGYEWAMVEPKANVWAADLRMQFSSKIGEHGERSKLEPGDWYHGIIHDQVVAWAAYFAGQGFADDDVTAAVWAMVDQARDAGTPIDNARGHIDTAIRWVLRKEAGNGPGLD